MDATLIRKLVKTGESETVEFKSRLVSDRAVATVLASFANNKGGTLIIGIDDEGVPVGLNESEAMRAVHLIEGVAESLLPYSAGIGTVELDGKKLVFADVNPAPAHFIPIRLADGKVLYREEDRNRVLHEADFVRYLGFSKASEQKMEVNGSLKLFVAMSFREEEEPALVDYFHAIKRAVEQTKLPIEIVRIDLEEGDYEISQQIMSKIEDCEIVLADFTLSSSNVYFELGYARGKNKRVIQTAKKDTKLEFDVRNWRTVFYRNATELERGLKHSLKSAYSDVISTQST